MIIAITCVVAIAVIAFILGVRPKDLPEPEPVSPFQHLDERKAAIYENLRDLQFEYRVGKLSDDDYQSTKKDLQKELAARAGRSRPDAQAGAQAPAAAAPPEPPPRLKLAAATRLDSCAPHAAPSSSTALKFCGECGKPMKVAQ